MALKDIFNLIKADRYTADGCEEIKKAQEAIAEDAGLPDGTMRHRKDGDYIKQAGKWVPAPAAKGKPEKGSKEDVKQRLGAYVKAMNKKNGEFAGRSKKLGESSEQRAQESLAELNRASAESKQEEKKTSQTKVNTTSVTEWEESAKKDAKAYNENMVVLQNEKGETTAVRESSPDVEKAEAHGYKKMSLVRPDGSVKKHSENNAEKKPALKLPDEKSSFATDVNRMKKLKKEDYKQYTIQLEKLHSKYPINKWKDLYNKTLNDAAPRELTGDCKIRIRNSK